MGPRLPCWLLLTACAFSLVLPQAPAKPQSEIPLHSVQGPSVTLHYVSVGRANLSRWCMAAWRITAPGRLNSRPNGRSLPRLTFIGYQVIELQNTERIGSSNNPESGGAGSVASGDGVALISQILGQVPFHFHRRLIRHGVEVLVKLRQQLVTVPFHDPGRFVAVFVVQKSLIDS